MITYRALGKILICGGYGVLQHHNIGLVLALENSFYSIISQTKNQKQIFVDKINILVSSPQINQHWKYQFNLSTQIFQSLLDQNPFLQNAIKFSLLFIKNIIKLIPSSLKIILCFQQGFLSGSCLEHRFPFYKERIKTGIGSSACVIVCTVGALCKYYLTKTKDDLSVIVECISHVANLAAQNKIGSNFDIACAVRGTHLYCNQLPKIAFQCIKTKDISPLLQIIKPHQPPAFSPFIYKIQTFLLDFKQGQNTRTTVSSFHCNLMKLSPQIREEFYVQSKQITLSLYNTLQKCQNEIQLKKQLKQINKKQRKLQIKFGKLTQTEIEPQDLGIIINKILQCVAVLYAICPGAGGHDAVFIMATQQPNHVYQQIQAIVQQKAQIIKINVRWRPLQAIIPTELSNFLK